MAETAPSTTAHGRIDPLTALVAGLSAGVIATVAQIAMWWLAGMPVPEIIFRDTRLTAAKVMGSALHWRRGTGCLLGARSAQEGMVFDDARTHSTVGALDHAEAIREGKAGTRGKPPSRIDGFMAASLSDGVYAKKRVETIPERAPAGTVN